MPRIVVPIWHGTTDEAWRLIAAISSNCECAALKRNCPAHEAMLDQHWLDHILWLRWLHLKENACRSERLAPTQSPSAG